MRKTRTPQLHTVLCCLLRHRVIPIVPTQHNTECAKKTVQRRAQTESAVRVSLTALYQTHHVPQVVLTTVTGYHKSHNHTKLLRRRNVRQHQPE